MSEQKELIETLVEQIQDLEDQIELILTENERLRQENAKLRFYTQPLGSVRPAGKDPTPVPHEEGWNF